jgi:hypothetical protein
MAIDLNKFGIKPDPKFMHFGTPDVYDYCWNFYHEQLAIMTAKPDAETGKTLSAKRAAVRDNWRTTSDLTPEDHEALEAVQQQMEITCYSEDGGDVKRLETLLALLTLWTTRVKGQLDYEVDKLSNPHQRIVAPRVDKADLKELREFATVVVKVNNDSMHAAGLGAETTGVVPLLVEKEWANLPQGRMAGQKDADGGKYIGRRYVFQIDNIDAQVNPTQLCDWLTENTDERWTTLMLMDAVSEANEQWGKPFANVSIGGHTIEALYI